MYLKQVFIQNLKNFRKKENVTQMKLAEYCNTAPSYIGEIEIGRKFPSTEMIERIAEALRIEPYHLFRDWMKTGGDSDHEGYYPILPVSMKNEIKNQIESAICEIFEKY